MTPALHGRRAGFTLTEVIVAASIMVVVMAGIMTGFVHLLRTADQSNNQNELDVQVQVATERLKTDLRLSALDRMFFYPPGSNTYTAVSFPIARDDNGDGMVEVDTNRNIVWDQTVVYHAWQKGSTNELRVTTFRTRDNTLTPAQRQAQLNSVVTNGNGKSTYESASASTRTLFRNLFTWTLTPRGALYDGYSPTVDVDKDTILGFATLASGNHTYTFKVVDCNPNSAGYAIGLDTLLVSPSYGVREAEEQLPATAYAGNAPVDLYVPGGSVSGSRLLWLPAADTNSFVTLTLDNDRWEETNFADQDVNLSNTVVEMDESLDPNNIVARLEGGTNTWEAADATGDTYGQSAPSDIINGAAVRVLLRGADMVDGMELRCGGQKCRINFRAADTPVHDKLYIRYAYIMPALDPTNALPDSAGGQQQLHFWGFESVTLNSGDEIWSDWVNMPIDPDQSYLVAFLANKTKARATTGERRGCGRKVRILPTGVAGSGWPATRPAKVN